MSAIEYSSIADCAPLRVPPGLTRPPGHKIAGEKFHARFFLPGGTKALHLGGRRPQAMQFHSEGLPLVFDAPAGSVGNLVERAESSCEFVDGAEGGRVRLSLCSSLCSNLCCSLCFPIN